MDEILIVLANGAEECEALCVYDILKRGGLNPVLKGLGSNRIVSSHSVSFLLDDTLSEKDLEKNYRVVFLPGGMPGATNLRESEVLSRILKRTSERGDIVAAICASPAVVLGPLGLLEGHKATCYPGCEEYYKGFTFRSEGVVTSGNIITAKSAGWAFDLGLEILRVLKGEDEKERVRKQIYYK